MRWVCVLGLLTAAVAVGALSATPDLDFEEAVAVSALGGGATLVALEGEHRIAGPAWAALAHDPAHFAHLPAVLVAALHRSRVETVEFAVTSGPWLSTRWGPAPALPSTRPSTLSSNQSLNAVSATAPVGAFLLARFATESDAMVGWPRLVRALSSLVCGSLAPQWIHPNGVHRPVSLERGARLAFLPTERPCVASLRGWLALFPSRASAGVGALLNPTVAMGADFFRLGFTLQRARSETGASLVLLRASAHYVVPTRRYLRPSVLGDAYPIETEHLYARGPAPVSPADQWATVRGDRGDRGLEAGEHRVSLASLLGVEAGTRPWAPTAVASVSTLWVGSMESPAPLVDEAHRDEREMRALSHARLFEPLPRDERRSPRAGVTLQRGVRVERLGFFVDVLAVDVRSEQADATIPLLELLVAYPLPFRPVLQNTRVRCANANANANANAIANASVSAPESRVVRQPRKEAEAPLFVSIRLAGPSCVVEVPVEVAFLHSDRYPADVQRGFDLPSACVRGIRGETSVSDASDSRAPTAPLRSTQFAGCVWSGRVTIEPPGPDFSMPYNVIALVSTASAFLLGSLLNLAARKPRRRTEGGGGEEEGEEEVGARCGCRGLCRRQAKATEAGPARGWRTE